MERRGNACSVNTCRITSPTAPVAPTTATLGITGMVLSQKRIEACTTHPVLDGRAALGKSKSPSGRFAQPATMSSLLCHMNSSDWQWMQRALELAERGRGYVEPNPLVGAVLVRDDQLLGEGWHQQYGQAHAEIHALAVAGEAARGATLYVTLEPCCPHGTT